MVGKLEMTSVTFALQGKYLEALPIAQRALTIFQKTLGPGHPHTQRTAAGVQQLELAAIMVRSVTANQTNDAASEAQSDDTGDASCQMIFCCW